MMKHELFRQGMALLTEVIEIALGLLLTTAVVICAIQMIPDLMNLQVSMGNMHGFREYLEGIFNLVIGVEALKMIYKHSPGSAIEVLLYTLARELVVQETTVVENLILIVCITILFAVRKFLFVPAFGSHIPHSITHTRQSVLSPDVQQMLDDANILHNEHIDTQTDDLIERPGVDLPDT